MKEVSFDVVEKPKGIKPGKRSRWAILAESLKAGQCARLKSEDFPNSNLVHAGLRGRKIRGLRSHRDEHFLYLWLDTKPNA